jgi:FkbH-like protein
MTPLQTVVTSARLTERPIAYDEQTIRSVYRGLLMREADPEVLQNYVNRIRGGWQIEDVVHNIIRSEEFASVLPLVSFRKPENSAIEHEHSHLRRRPADPNVISDLEYRCPVELSVSPTPIRRLIVIGECLLETWSTTFQEIQKQAKCDFFLYNGLPRRPPADFLDYDFQLLGLPLRAVLPDSSFFRLPYLDVKAYESLFQDCCDRLFYFLAQGMKWNREQGLLTFVMNFALPQQNPMGRLMPRYDLRNLRYFIGRLNETLAHELANYSNAFIFDFDEVISTFGRKYFQDDVIGVTSHNGALCDYDFQYDQERLEPPLKASELYPWDYDLYFHLGWAELLAMYRTIRQLDMVKLVVVDLDDTVWRGVAAERLGDLPEATEGWPVGFVEALANLKRRGVLLAIVSKNEEALVAPIWERLYGEVFTLDDFAIRKINWRTKAENLEEILREVNLLPRSVVYIDDNPVERAAIKSAFPDVRTFGPTPLTWRRILLWSPETQVVSITTESGHRTEMVRAQVERERQRQQLSREDFLAALNVTMNIRELGSVEQAEFPRVLELINKTNQFNTTGKRWSRQEVSAALANHARFFIFDVKDKFTNYGIVGAIIVRDANLEQFVMSCRVAGLEVEIAAISYVLGSVWGNAEGPEITAELVETDLNLAARDLWQRCGFHQRDGLWSRPRSEVLAARPHIAMSFAASEALNEPGATAAAKQPA